MDITSKCIISGTYGFDLRNSNKFAIIEVEGKNGDIIKVNKADGIKYAELWTAYEYPHHDEHPIVDNKNKVIVIGGNDKKSARTLCVIGK
ncbi:MAG: hypothetical protein COT15_03715 [Candidatus Diapherotrites archaeon CG08_land_8_20_14_0_20_34_12]|nr:MAG: hypothetical protein COT15_03715 [Candidatus Diapherotrites archaeon CG08_land_8_20_14_0_20_34_12]